MIAFAGPRAALAALTLAVLSSLAGLPAAADAAELVVFGSARCPYCLAWEREIGHSYAKTGRLGWLLCAAWISRRSRPADLTG